MNPSIRRRQRQAAEATRPTEGSTAASQTTPLVPRQRIGYDELLSARVKELKEIDERLERIVKRSVSGADYRRRVIELQLDMADMIRAAEAEHAAF